MTWLVEAPLAHRGLHDEDLPENSMVAFEAAVHAGYGIELDVHLSRDGEVFVIHDDDLLGATGSPGRVTASTSSQLRARRLRGGEHGLPTLEEVLALVGGRVPVMVEIKNMTGRVGPLEAAVRDRIESYKGRVTVASFNPRTVGWFARNAPGVLRGQTATTFGTGGVPPPLGTAMRSLSFARYNRPHYISYALDGLPNRWTDAWRAKGRPLIAWTVRTPADLERVAELADNHIFEGVRP